jgi:hypothetical protein
VRQERSSVLRTQSRLEEISAIGIERVEDLVDRQRGMKRKSYASDVSDGKWEFVMPYLTLMPPDAPQRHHDLREVFNALRWLVRTGSPWRYFPNDLPR